jgi:Sec-independent protein translocase protein TatA
MFEVSWGELMVVTGLGFALIGKKDLPRAAGWFGNRMGRVVGLLQGARSRAEQFAQQTELKQLHDEFKTGLRELNVVKSEMSSTMSARGMNIGMGSGGGGSRTTLIKPVQLTHELHSQRPPVTQNSTTGTISPSPSTSALPLSMSSQPSGNQLSTTTTRELAPEYQTIGAIAEDEWEKQGMGFRSRAERGVGLGYSDQDANNPLNSGSSILAHIYKQNLIYDQYNRVTQLQATSKQPQHEQQQQQLLPDATDPLKSDQTKVVASNDNQGKDQS